MEYLVSLSLSLCCVDSKWDVFLLPALGVTVATDEERNLLGKKSVQTEAWSRGVYFFAAAAGYPIRSISQNAGGGVSAMSFSKRETHSHPQKDRQWGRRPAVNTVTTRTPSWLSGSTALWFWGSLKSPREETANRSRRPKNIRRDAPISGFEVPLCLPYEWRDQKAAVWLLCWAVTWLKPSLWLFWHFRSFCSLQGSKEQFMPDVSRPMEIRTGMRSIKFNKQSRWLKVCF